LFHPGAGAALRIHKPVVINRREENVPLVNDSAKTRKESSFSKFFVYHFKRPPLPPTHHKSVLHERKTHLLSKLSFISALVFLVLLATGSLYSFLFAIPALVLGIIGFKFSKSSWALAGLIFGAIGIGLALFIILPVN